MLQFITNESARLPIPEQVRLAIEGGCRWIQLRMKHATDAEVAEMAREITPICRDNDAILVIDDRVDVVMETKVHGVHLGKEDMEPAKAREYLGPHAIIGCTANTAADILALAPIDIDYIGLGPFRFTTTKERLSPVIGAEGYRKIIAEVRAAGCELPIVAIGGIEPADVPLLLETGVNGIAISGAIVNSPDPAATVASILLSATAVK